MRTKWNYYNLIWSVDIHRFIKFLLAQNYVYKFPQSNVQTFVFNACLNKLVIFVASPHYIKVKPSIILAIIGKIGTTDRKC